MTNFQQQRFTGTSVALFLGWFLFQRAQSSWVNYWLLADSKQGTAIVTNELWSGHDAVGYNYQVGQQEYTGKDVRPWHRLKNNGLHIGEQTIVYYSESHPWLSLLNRPRTFVEGWPVVLIALIIEVFAIIAIFNPKSGWALGSETKAK
jgi:hypothetical protein